MESVCAVWRRTAAEPLEPSSAADSPIPAITRVAIRANRLFGLSLTGHSFPFA
jgi:hypothetical protein